MLTYFSYLLHFTFFHFTLCIYIFLFKFYLVYEEPSHPCNPSPCGANAVCNERNGAGACTCITGYFGDPYSGCRPECLTNNDCSHDKSCLNMKCVNPCLGSCGVNAECTVINHNPQCYCIAGYTGNALTLCREIEQSKTHFYTDSQYRLDNINSYLAKFKYFYMTGISSCKENNFNTSLLKLLSLCSGECLAVENY